MAELFPEAECTRKEHITPDMDHDERVSVYCLRAEANAKFKETIFYPGDANRLTRYSTAWDSVELMVESRDFREDEFPDLENEPSE